MKLIVHRTHRDNHYATVNLTCVEDPRISGLAKALHLYAMSRPEGWRLQTQDLVSRFREGKEAIYAALKQLEDAGYLVRQQGKRRKGRFGSFVCHWYEEPNTSPLTGFPEAVELDAVEPEAVNPTHSINQGTNNQEKRVCGYSPEFEVFWEAYPRKLAKRQAWQCWNARLNDGVPAGDLLLACRNYRDYVAREGIPLRYVMHAATFLGPNLRYQDWIQRSEQGIFG